MTQQKQDILNSAKALLGQPLAVHLDLLFRCMELTKKEIAAATTETPEHRERLHRSFRALQPGDVLLRRGPESLYRTHSRELLARVRAGEDLRTSTTAEVLALLSALFLEAPLDRAATLLYWNLFGTLFPHDAEHLRSDVDPLSEDSYDQLHATELGATLRRKLAVPTRGLLDTIADKTAA